MKAYRVVIEQDHPDRTYPYKEQIDVLATDARVGLGRALRVARKNGFHPRRKLHVLSLIELSAEIE
jgi:hypothetical protein